MMMRIVFKQGLLEIHDLHRALSREEVDDLSNGIGISSQEELTFLESASGDIRFPPFQDDHAVFKFAVVEGFPIQLNLLVRKTGIPVSCVIVHLLVLPKPDALHRHSKIPVLPKMGKPDRPEAGNDIF